MKIACRCLVSGRVQGVGFRYFVAAEARALKVCGSVRNLADGRVEALLEGEQQAVDTLLAKIREGPRWSRVDGIQVDPMAPSGRYGSFQITG